MNTQRSINHVLHRTMRGLLYATVSAGLVIGAGQAQAEGTCPVYGLQDNDLNNTQLFKVVIDPSTMTTTAINIGPVYTGYDIEGLVIHPVTGALFASSGDDTQDGHPIGTLYNFNPVTGALTEIGFSFDGEISALAFSADGSQLWGWVDGKGAISIDQVTGAGTMHFASTAKIEDIAAGKNANGDDILYGVEGDNLYAYNMSQETDALEFCDKLPSEAEAITVLEDGTLLYALHKTADTRLYQFNMQAESCQIMNTAPISTVYYDIEGIAVPTGCKLCPIGEWQYEMDSFTDSTETTQTGMKAGGTSFEIYGMAMKQQGDMITVAISTNLPMDGGWWPKKGGGELHIGWGDLIFDFSGSKVAGKVTAPSDDVYGVRFNNYSDSGVAEKGLYKVDNLKSVVYQNHGHLELFSYQARVNRAGGVASLGELPVDDSYFTRWAKAGQVPTSIGSGNLISPLKAPQEYALTDLDFDLTGAVEGLEPESKNNASKNGEIYTISFSFQRTPEMTGDFTAYLFTECLNDGIIFTGTLDDCPNDE